MWSTNHIAAGTTCSSLRPTRNRAVTGAGSGSGCCATLWEMSTVPWQKTPGSEAALWLFHWCLSLFLRWAPPAWPQQQLCCDKSDRTMKSKSNWSRLSLLKRDPQGHHSLLLFCPCLLQLCADTGFALWEVVVCNCKKLPHVLVLPITHAWK